MDLTYATISMFGGETKRLYRENQLSYITSDEKNSVNHPIYAVDTDFGACILQIDDSHPIPMQLTKPTYQQPKEVTTSVWSMFLDEEPTDIFPNLFQDPVADNLIQESSSLSLEFYHDVPIFDKYSDEEEDFKVWKVLSTYGI